MDRRQTLQNLLLTMSTNVYYQPPASVKMKYPCIVYALDAQDAKFADNGPYSLRRGYQLTVITREADNNEIFAAISELPLCSFSQHFVADNLYHDVFSLYF